MFTKNQGIFKPSIDDLLKATKSKYALVILSAKRARQINSYYSHINDESFLEYTNGPLIEVRENEKFLSIALKEISKGLITYDTNKEN